MTNQRKRSKIIFYIALLAFPVIQFTIFYICVNFNGIILSFKIYNDGNYDFAGFSNYQKVIDAIFNDGVFRYAIENSFKVFAVDMLLIMPLTLFFSFYIAKKYPFYKTLRVILFMPTIISSIVMVLIYRYFLEDAIPEIINLIIGQKSQIESFLFGASNRRMFYVFVYYVWVAFGPSIIIYSGSMSGISTDVIEAAELDGAIGIKEFFYITIPLIWPTITVLTLAKLTGFFTNKLNLFSFYGTSALNQNYTIGYYLFKNTYGDLATMSVFPYLSAMGIVFTIIIAPITIIIKKLMEKFGPSEE